MPSASNVVNIKSIMMLNLASNRRFKSARNAITKSNKSITISKNELYLHIEELNNIVCFLFRLFLTCNYEY